MGNLANAGRIFYGIAITGLGFQTIYQADFPYMLIPPKHQGIPGLVLIAYISGALLILAGACIVIFKKNRIASLLLGTVLLMIFCFYFIPYKFIATSNYMQLLAWDSAGKELALSAGAFVIAGSFPEKNETSLTRVLSKLIPLGVILFSIMMICFGTLHFLHAKEVSQYIPSWVPYKIFWTYAGGTGLLGSGLAIILKIKPGLMATLLGTMIFIWFIILHIPYVMASPLTYKAGEITSAFLALAYCGIAFVIAGTVKKQQTRSGL